MTLEADQTYRFDLKGWPAGGSVRDTYLRGIHDANGTLIAGTMADDGGARLDSGVTFTPTEGGTYYVAAGAYASYQGTYTLSVEEVIDGI